MAAAAMSSTAAAAAKYRIGGRRFRVFSSCMVSPPVPRPQPSRGGGQSNVQAGYGQTTACPYPLIFYRRKEKAKGSAPFPKI